MMEDQIDLFAEIDFISQSNPKIKVVSFGKHDQKITSVAAKFNFFEVSLETAKNKKILRYFPRGLSFFKKEAYMRMLQKEAFSEKIPFIFTGQQKEKLISADISPDHEIYHLPLTKIKKISDDHPFKKKV